MSLVKNILSNIKFILPKIIIQKIIQKAQLSEDKKFKKKLRNNIINFYKNSSEVTIEQKKVLTFLENNPVEIFPYDFRNNYSIDEINVLLDIESGLKYVMHYGKKLFFKRNATDRSIKNLYYGLQLDQDKDSPHSYIAENFNLNSDDVLADIGAAEGNFSLTHIEKIKKVYLFENNPEWIEALEMTFKPWKNKAEIINKFVTNSDSDNDISLDSFNLKNKDITFIKADIEGEEENLLKGASDFLRQNKSLKIVICSYHKHDDETILKEILSNNNFQVEASNGFMIFIYDKFIKAPYLRRGVLRAVKNTL